MRELVIEVAGVGRIKLMPGRTMLTPGAEAAMPMHRIVECLERHADGDWGVCPPPTGPSEVTDQLINNLARHIGYGRMHSAYPIDPDAPCTGYGDNTLWIITEYDHRTTTILLPEEY